MVLKPSRFISETIEVGFDQPPALEKKPGCPTEFTWRGFTYRIDALMSEWVDYQRRGRMARNMIPTHTTTAERRGSWGVGLFYFIVRAINRDTQTEQFFEIYYDRAPKDVNHRKGAWFLYCELTEHN